MVIVYENEPIDNALKRLYREMVRENILNVFRRKRFHISKSDIMRDIKREYAKTKKRSRREKRRLRNKI